MGSAFKRRPSRLDDMTFSWLEIGGDSENQLALILESLELLDEADARVIRAAGP